MQASKQTAVMLVLTDAFRKKQLNTHSGIDFSVDVYKIIHRINKEQKLHLKDMDAIDMAIHFLTEIAKGKDGVIGTADDLLEPKVIDEMTEMLRSNFMNDMFKVVTGAVKLELSWPRTRFFMTKYFCMSAAFKERT
jgi:hypothetical protein